MVLARFMSPREFRQRVRRQQTRIVDRGLDLSSVSNDGGIGHQSVDVAGCHRRNGERVESVKRRTQVVTLVEDDPP
jgi:hypothetical protein